MKSNTFVIFIVLVITTTPAICQTKIWLETGLNHSFLKSDLYYFDHDRKHSLSSTSFCYGLKTDTYFNYNFALTSGILFWENGYDTKGHSFVIEQNSLKPIDPSKTYDPPISPQDIHNDIRNKWKNSFLQIPVGLKFSPQGKLLAVAGGVDFNFLLKSKLTDVMDTQNHYLTTDITHNMPKVLPAIFLSIGGKIKNLSITFKAFKFQHNLYSVSAQNAVLANDVDKQAHIASLYYSLGTAPMNSKTISYQILLSYRLF